VSDRPLTSDDAGFAGASVTRVDQARMTRARMAPRAAAPHHGAMPAATTLAAPPPTSRELRRALTRGELTPWYQPIVRLSDGVVRGFEALVRWDHPRLGLLPASAFVALAEDSGAVQAVDERVWHEVMEQVARWQGDVLITPGFTVTMNMSPLDLDEVHPAAAIARAIDQTGVDPCGLTFEITETRLVDDSVTAFRSALEVHDLGVQLALDDFGARHSAFSLVQALPFAMMKIDRAIVAAAGTEGSGEMIRAMVAVARRLPTTVVAEGIESFNELRAAVELGCDHGQGHWWAAPFSADEAESFLMRGPEEAPPPPPQD
jgi:c-di-GMP-specific phosphodiesterase